MPKKDATKPTPKTPATTKATKTPTVAIPTTDLLSVSDVAREASIDPKAARAALRAAGRKPKDGRWPKVARGSAEHDALLMFFEGNQDGVDSSSPKAKT